ncbi:hypothetical protein [Aerosticca soli]|uniref:hypothetical protein n=1 Tax=Aerosticca soli TaxID=2010829 RepID=UPI0013A5D363|nr:hypothetical protein [Aerosticca soli]
MKKTYVDVLQALPPDETLHQFLASHGLAVPPALDAQPHEPPNRAVIEAIMTWGDTSARDGAVGARPTRSSARSRMRAKSPCTSTPK